MKHEELLLLLLLLLLSVRQSPTCPLLCQCALRCRLLC
jgi:hypothetical protein